jgi:hypothetical protein
MSSESRTYLVCGHAESLKVRVRQTLLGSEPSCGVVVKHVAEKVNGCARRISLGRVGCSHGRTHRRDTGQQLLESVALAVAKVLDVGTRLGTVWREQKHDTQTHIIIIIIIITIITITYTYRFARNGRRQLGRRSSQALKHERQLVDMIPPGEQHSARKQLGNNARNRPHVHFTI